MAKKKPKCPDCPKCLPGWLAQFADLMSLLLVFFILLLSMSSLDARKVSEAIGSMAWAASVLEGGQQTEVSVERLQKATPIVKEVETAEVVNRITRTIAEINEIVKFEGGGNTVRVNEAEDGFSIEMPASLLFKPASAKIVNADAILFLKRIALIIPNLPPNIDILIRGHTDDSQINTQKFKNNWELSAARAISVAQVLIASKVNPKLISATGNAQYRPIASNALPDGKARNRRVMIHFIEKEVKNKPLLKSVLD